MATILIVDPERLFGELLGQVLTQAGFEVLTARSGAAALDLFQQRRPQVTILELQLPDKDGATLLRPLRRLDHTVSAIVLTGAANPILEEEVRTLGVNDFLRKDQELEKVLQAVGTTKAEPAFAAPTSPMGELEGGARILVVDDDPDIRETLSELLIQQGYGVQTACGGAEGLRLIKDIRPHLMLLDLAMPGMDGLAVLRTLPRLAPDVGVIVVSAVQDEGMLREAMKLGSFDCLGKPVDPERLGVSVRAKLTLMEVKRRPWWRR